MAGSRRVLYPPSTMMILLTLAAFPAISALIPEGMAQPSETPRPQVTHCELYNSTQCTGDNSLSPVCKKESHPCEDLEKANQCFVVWSNMSGTPEVIYKGCLWNYKTCKDECISTEPVNSLTEQKPHLFCCCNNNNCNQNFSWQPKVEVPSTTPEGPLRNMIPAATGLMAQGNRAYTGKRDKNLINILPPQEQDMVVQTVAWTLGTLILLVVTVTVLFYLYRRQKMANFMAIPRVESTALVPPSPPMGLRPIQLREIKARGRFGAVWKANLHNDVIAVKIFPVQDKQSWLVETEVYSLPQLSHENILHYIGAEKRGDSLQAEFWLITAYHERGSLCDFLKANLVTWDELCKIGESMARGLMYMHEEQPASKCEALKPAIAHRDFKSKNVLLKNDLTACIADFGLALTFHPGQSTGDTHGQVGTRRYMAPEVLEGAINFQRDAFLRIDMYACGLVLWELLSRCSSPDGPIPEYHLPFEEEVGQHPTLDDMQECVVTQKARPVIHDHWRKNAAMMGLIDTMEECWDHDAEARLSASCVVERLASFSRNPQFSPTSNPQKESSI